MISKESVGVEISDTYLAIAYAKATPFDTEICAQAVHDLGGTGRFAEKIDTIMAAVKDFWRQHRIGDACIWIGLPAEMVFQRVISLPLAAKENLGKALEYELQKYMPLELEDIYLGHQILDEDRTIVESQPGDVADAVYEISVASDAPTVRFRRWYKELLLAADDQPNPVTRSTVQ